MDRLPAVIAIWTALITAGRTRSPCQVTMSMMDSTIIAMPASTAAPSRCSGTCTSCSRGPRTVRYDPGRARPYLRNRGGALPVAPGSPAHYARANPEVIGESAKGASLSKSIFAG